MKRTVLLLALVGATTLLVAGAALAMTVRCSGGECRGTGMADRIFGSASEEVIFAGDGDDRVYGRGGNDVLKGAQGNDEIYGQRGPDRPKGGTGKDMVFGGLGDDLVRGGTHSQTNDGVRDILDCGGGTDTVYFTPGVDEVRDCEILNPPQ